MLENLRVLKVRSVQGIMMTLILAFFFGCGILPESGAIPQDGKIAALEPADISIKTNLISSNDNGNTITVNTGDFIQIQLQAATSGGYEWVYGQAPNSANLVLANTCFVTLYPDRVGSPSMENMIYQALASGKTSILLNQNQPWMTNTQPPIGTFSLTVLINGASSSSTSSSRSSSVSSSPSSSSSSSKSYSSSSSSSVVVPGAPYSVSYVISNDWGTGATINVCVINNGPTTVNGWTLKWTFPGNQQIAYCWNGNSTISGETVTVSDTGWNGTLAPNGGSGAFGFNINYGGADSKPASVMVNGETVPIQ